MAGCVLSPPGLREAPLGLCPAFGRSSQAPGETTPHDGTCWGHKGEEGPGHPSFLVPYQPPHWGPRDHDSAATQAAPPYDTALELYEKLPLDLGRKRLIRKRGNRQALPGAVLPAQARTFQAPEPAMGSTEPISASRGEVTAGAPQSRTPVGPPAGRPSHCAAPAALDLALEGVALSSKGGVDAALRAPLSSPTKESQPPSGVSHTPQLPQGCSPHSPACRPGQEPDSVFQRRELRSREGSGLGQDHTRS